MVDSLNRLRHDAVVCGDYQNRYIGNLSASRSHCRERFVSRGIDKRDLLTFDFYRICAYLLCNTASFARCDFTLSDVVQKRSFAVVDVTHYRNDRRSRNERLGAVRRIEILFRQSVFKRLFEFKLELDAEIACNERRRFKIDIFVYRFYDIETEQFFDNFRARLTYLFGKVFYGKHFGIDDGAFNLNCLRFIRFRLFRLIVSHSGVVENLIGIVINSGSFKIVIVVKSAELTALFEVVFRRSVFLVTRVCVLLGLGLIFIRHNDRRSNVTALRFSAGSHRTSATRCGILRTRLSLLCRIVENSCLHLLFRCFLFRRNINSSRLV